MAYSQYTQAQALSELSNLLGDPANVYWTLPELTRYLYESLYTWGAMTNYWRDTIAITIQPDTAFYDLTAYEPLILTQTNLHIYLQVLDVLLEQGGITSNLPYYQGSEQFTLETILFAINQARDRFLLDTGVTVTRYPALGISPPPANRTTIPDTVVDIVRAAWTDQYNYTTPLDRDDTLDLYLHFSGSQPGTPVAYSISTTRATEILLSPTPLATGSLDMVTVNSGSSDINAAHLLGIPDNYSWGVKYGTLFSLFSKDGPARDPARASYCEGRYQQAVQAAKTYLSSVLIGTFRNDYFPMMPIVEADSFDYQWQSKPGPPAVSGLAGHNLFYSNPADLPDTYSVGLELTRRALIPDSPGAYIQVSNAEYEYIIDYARHLAALKMGGDEFRITQHHYGNFINAANYYNRRMKANAPTYSSQYGMATEQTSGRPRERSAAATAATVAG